MPKISVIVPVYKTEKYLFRCVDSLRNQTLKDIEIILVDDGSPDNCPEICDEYTRQDSRIRVIHKENGGVSTARNAGLDAAQGDYITFVDSDDYVDTEMYEQMLTVAVEHNCDVVMCDCLKEFPDHNVLYTHPIRPGYYDHTQLRVEYYPHLLMMENVEYPATISNWLILWRSTLNTADMRYEPGIRYSEDLLFGAKLLRKSTSFYYMKGTPFYHYVMNPGSATHRFVLDKWDDYLQLHQRICDYFSSDPDYDFSHQIDLCLLFFMYNAVGEILRAKQLSRNEKVSVIRRILSECIVRDMFKRLSIGNLPIAFKQKLLTRIYKARLAIRLLCAYYDKK